MNTPQKTGSAFQRVGKTPPQARALLNRLRLLRAAQARDAKPTAPMRAMYREAFGLLNEQNPQTSYVAIRLHINRLLNPRRA